MEKVNEEMIRKVKRWGDFNAAATHWGINLGRHCQADYISHDAMGAGVDNLSRVT
jgi:hypothetical protein